MASGEYRKTILERSGGFGDELQMLEKNNVSHHTPKH